MSFTHKVSEHLYLVMYSWETTPHYMTHQSAELEKQCDENTTYSYIRPVAFEIPNLVDPEKLDPNQFRLRGIQRAQRQLMAEYQKKLNELKAVEQSLLAIEMTTEKPDDDLPF